MEKKPIIAGVILAITLFLIWFGFDSHTSSIESYSTEFHTYVIANYSEIETGVDYNGEVYTETDSWREVVSEHWSVKTFLDSIVEYNCPKEMIKGHTCETPEISLPHDKGSDFDSYREIRDLTYYVDYGDGDYSIVDLEKYNRAKEKLYQKVIVNTWYGNAYSFED
jgi:hypothetical protein